MIDEATLAIFKTHTTHMDNLLNCNMASYRDYVKGSNVRNRTFLLSKLEPKRYMKL